MNQAITRGKLKRLIKPTLGFKSMKTACATIKGFEAMRALRKKQANAFQHQPDIRGEVRLVERAFGIGPEMMSEFMSLHGAELEQIAIQQGFGGKAVPVHTELHSCSTFPEFPGSRKSKRFRYRTAPWFF